MRSKEALGEIANDRFMEIMRTSGSNAIHLFPVGVYWKVAESVRNAVLDDLIEDAEKGDRVCNDDCHGCEINRDIVMWITQFKEQAQ